jgi:branched-chain amino acid transport system permease protein
VFGGAEAVTIALFTLLYVTGACAWNIFSGFSGYFSVGHATFYGIGAYAGLLFGQSWHVAGGWGMFVLVPVGGLVAALIAIPVGWLALRTRRMVFAMLTIAIFFVAQQLAYNLHGLTHGSLGVTAPIPPWTGDAYNVPFYYVAAAMAIFAWAFGVVIRRTRFGLGLLAIRDDEDRALGLGVRTTLLKMAALCLSAALTGMVGAIFGLFAGSIYPQFAFDPLWDVQVILCVLIGGIGTVYGPVVGALILIPAQQYLQIRLGLSGWFNAAYGALFIFIILVAPGGLVPAVTERLRPRNARRRRNGAPRHTAIAEVAR